MRIGVNSNKNKTIKRCFQLNNSKNEQDTIFKANENKKEVNKKLTVYVTMTK